MTNSVGGLTPGSQGGNIYSPSPASSPSVIASSSSRFSLSGKGVDVSMEDYGDGEYDSEVDGSPEPPAKRARQLSVELAKADIGFSQSGQQDEDEPMQEDEEDDDEVPCSVEE